MLLDKRHEIESMRQEAIDLEITVPDFSKDLPPALESINRTVVWVPYSERSALVQGLPRTTQEILLNDIKRPVRSGALITLFKAVMHVDALFYLNTVLQLSEEDKRKVDSGLLYRMDIKPHAIGSPTICVLLPRHASLPRFEFSWTDYKDLFFHHREEFPINAYLYKRWVYSATM